MKRKLQFLTKTLLVAAGLMAGVQSSWAADTFLTTWTGMVGTATNSGNFKYATKKINIAAGETYVYTLTNFNDGNNSNYWKNWVVEGNLGEKYFDCEARGNQWNAGDGPTPSYSPVMAYTDVDNFQTAYNGATVTITISRNVAGDQFTVTHTSNVLGTTAGNTEKYYGGTWTVAVGAEEDWDIYITEEESHFVVTNVSCTDADSNVTNHTPLYQRGYTTTWSSDDLGTGKWTGTGTCNATADGLNIAHANGTRTWTNTSQISPTSGYILKYDIVYNTGASYGTNNYAYLKIGDAITFTTSSQSQYGKVTIGSNDAISITNACSNTNGNREGDIWTIHIVVNTTTHKVTELTINGNKGTTKVNYSLAAEMSFSSSASFSSLTIGTYKEGTATNLWCGIKSINIDQEEYDAPKATVTYKYEDTSGNSLSAYKVDVMNSEVIGTTISELIAGDITATFYNGTSNKYIYADSYTVEGDYTTVQAGGNTVTLKFTDYPATAFTVKAQVSGSDLTTLSSGTAYLDGSNTVYWNKYIKVSDSWYVADDATYGIGITSATTNVAYTATDAIDQFYEFEALSNSGTILDATTGTTISGGDSKRFGANGKKWTPALTGGTYTVDLYCYGNNAKSVTLPMYYSDSDGSNVVYIGEATACTASAWGLKTTTNVVIPAGKSLCFFNNSSNTHNYIVDYMTLKRTGDATISATIGTTGYTTFASPYALNLSGITSNAGTTTAYYVTASDVKSSSVALTEATGNVAAGTGLILNGTAGATVTIPVVASGTDLTSTNMLKGCTVATDITSSTENYKNFYVLGASVAEFQNIKSWIDAPHTLTIPAGKAYLDTTGASVVGAPSLTFDFGETTGINTVHGSEFTVNGEYYDLQGRRVAQPTKGLYIVNGRKVVIK